METFDRKQTSWEGLWWHPELQCFTSASISLAKLKKFKGAVRITVKKNRWFSGGLNGRPNYVFCIRDSKAESEKEIEIEESEPKVSFTYDELQELINRVAEDIGGSAAYGNYLVSDYIDWESVAT